MKKIVIGVGGVAAFVPQIVSAHCPLCTAAAGVLAVGASYIGLSTIVVGVLVGAFALALGFWLAGLLKKQYVRYQYPIVSIAVFILTVLPIMPLIREYRPLYISLAGEYGTLLHTTYMINLFLAGSIVGALIVWGAPYISKRVTNIRGGSTWPYQGVGITIGSLVIVSIIAQLTF
ncbi:MAG: hypothetical protein WD049_08245 [Candidatus Paceibacterota bacterium]